ncbi:hypothetical protein [Azorhizobium caulinodans]|uniref:hypothetical protein n=1 Tax=Azorhizobium caulinodans TaxID=7 RepID=UPI002FBDB9BE
MATSTEDLKLHLKRVQDKALQLNWQDTITVLATPEPSLVTELGPLTTKLENAKTQQCAAVMALEFQANVKYQQNIRTTRSELNSSTIQSGNGGVEAFVTLAQAIDTLRNAVTTVGKTELEKPQPPSPVLKVLDALLAQSLMAVPYAGPFLSAAAQNAGTLLSAGVLTAFQSIANYALTAPPKDSSTLGTVLGGTTQTTGVASGLVSGAGKGVSGAIAKAVPVLGGYDGAVSFFYNLWAAKKQREKDAELDTIVQGGNLSTQVDVVRVMNTQTQNQVVSNKIYDRLFATVKPVAEEQKLEMLLNKKSDSIKNFYKKVPDTLDAYRQYVLQLMYASIVESLSDEIVSLHREIQGLSVAKKVSMPVFASATTQKFELAAVLVMGYYFYRYIKMNPAHSASLVTLMQKYYPGWTATSVVTTPPVLTTMMPTLNTESRVIAQGFINTQTFQSVIAPPPTGLKGIISSSEPYVSEAIETAGDSAGRYFGLLKSSISNTLAKNLRRGESNTPDIAKIVKLVAVCTLIVNEVLGAVARKASFSYQDSWIDVLADCEFLTRYSKWFGRISEDKKKQVTGYGKAVSESRLRFPGSLPSDAERTMVYMFASVVVLNVDLGKIVIGTQNWAKVRENLHKTISIINEAELD